MAESGLLHSFGRRTYVKAYRGFKSLSYRQGKAVIGETVELGNYLASEDTATSCRFNSYLFPLRKVSGWMRSLI